MVCESSEDEKSWNKVLTLEYLMIKYTQNIYIKIFN